MKQAFSLVELSIVLVILGLLTGGILAGQNLIRAAELRAVTTELQSFTTAVMTFKDKYLALPGDMANATYFWTSAGGSGSIGDGCEAATGTGTQTCNGDGDGRIYTAGNADEYIERYTFWQHLANAGLIEGNYSGISGSSSSSHHVLGTNSPRGKLSNGGWGALYLSIGAGNATVYDLDYRNILFFGTDSTTGGPWDPILSPEEAWNIDTKIDDGKPAYGKVIGTFWDDACSKADDGGHANNDFEASYKLSDSSIQCAFYFRRFF